MGYGSVMSYPWNQLVADALLCKRVMVEGRAIRNQSNVVQPVSLMKLFDCRDFECRSFCFHFLKYYKVDARGLCYGKFNALPS